MPMQEPAESGTEPDRRIVAWPRPCPPAVRRRAAALLLVGLGLTMLVGACGPKPSLPPPPDLVQITNPPAGWDPTAPGAGQTIADAARGRLGMPYLYGGSTQRGYDCSGLVYRIYLEHGIRLPRTVRDQVKSGIDAGRPRPGDLLFFRLGRGKVSHVGIYLGDGKFVHASSGRQEIVMDDLNVSDYFRRRYAGARRIVPFRPAD